MGKLIAITGTTGIGKTSLVHALAGKGDFSLGVEHHADRPYQQLFKNNPQFAFANQVDYLLFRAEQENRLRRGNQTCLLDGGLDQDFHGFTCLFHERGYLNDAEFDICKRFYQFCRSQLPGPDLIIHLTADMDTIKHRLAGRKRINIAGNSDLELLNSLLEEWLQRFNPDNLIRLDVTHASPNYEEIIPSLIYKITKKFHLDAGKYDTGYIP